MKNSTAAANPVPNPLSPKPNNPDENSEEEQSQKRGRARGMKLKRSWFLFESVVSMLRSLSQVTKELFGP